METRRDSHDGRFVAAIAIAWALFAAAVYLPDVGRGFVKDDFRWVESGRAALADPAGAFLRPRTDFYRPIVELTFAADFAAHGLQPRGYGLTNLALYAACIAAVFALARGLAISRAAAAAAALVWAVNPHGINMALVWLSGRTSLCLTLFAILAALATVRRRYLLISLFTAAALGSKEEAVLLPIVLFAWDRMMPAPDGRPSRRHDAANWRLIAALTIPLAAYTALRLHAGAMTPASAPSYCQLTFAPGLLVRNIIEYVDRTMTICAIALMLTAIVWHVRPAVDRTRGRFIAASIVWIAGGFALTLFVPVRSSLYAVFPSVGAAIAAGVVIDAMQTTPERRVSNVRLALTFGLTLVAAIPIYRDRNGRYVEPARLSERALRTIAPVAAAAPDGGAIVLHDVDDPASSFVGAFGTFATSAIRMRSGRAVTVWIDPPPDDWQHASVARPRRDEVRMEFAVDRGTIFRVGP